MIGFNADLALQGEKRTDEINTNKKNAESFCGCVLFQSVQK